MTRFLTSEEALTLHQLLIDKYGGDSGVRDWGLIESALQRPQTGFGDQEAYPDILMKVAVLFHSLVNNHGFIDGNKRVGFASCDTFLLLNKIELDVTDRDAVKMTLDVAKGKADEHAIYAWLKSNTQATR
jgi:death-on-curing protein